MNHPPGLRITLSLPLIAVLLSACGGNGPGGGTGFGPPNGSGGGGPDGGGVHVNGGDGGATAEACSAAGSTRACCVTGTETCGSGEFPTWGPCLDPKGNVLTCGGPGTGGSGNEDGGGPGTGGNGNEDGGGPGTGGGGNEDGGGPGTGGGGNEDGGMPALCQLGAINNEPEILVGYLPASGQTVGQTGQIKVWVNDEGSPFIAPNEQIDPATGIITTPGDRTAKAPDGYLWEPALYIAPQTAENGGTPHFPTAIRGNYNNQPPTKGAGLMTKIAIDPPPAGSQLHDKYTAEDIWDVSSLGLAAGTYTGEFVIHDGDRDRGVGCVTIVISGN